MLFTLSGKHDKYSRSSAKVISEKKRNFDFHTEVIK